jgi:TPR repeat protein
MANVPSPELLAAAENGDAEAQNAVGRFYVELGSADAIEMAEFWFKRAADNGLPKAMHNLGFLAYGAGRSDLAQKWFSAAAERGWLNSTVALAFLLEEAGREQEAVALYEAAAEKGNADAQNKLGDRALKLDTEEGYAKARYWLQLAAAQGSEDAEARLGLIYHEGLGVERDPKRAAHYWLRAARSGHPGAQFHIGVAYDIGKGVEADRVESAYWLSLAAPKDELAEIYLEGVERSLSLSEKALLQARLRQATSH